MPPSHRLIRRGLAPLAAFMLAAAGSAGAQEIAIRADRQPFARAYGEALAARVFSDAFTAQRQAALATSLGRVPGFACSPAASRALVAVFPWRGVRDRRAWIERYQVACSPEAYRNLLMVEEGEGLRVLELAPGRSNTDPLLQRDLRTGLAAAATRDRPAGCTEAPLVTDVVLDGMDGPGAWRETWHLSLCSKPPVPVRVSFTPAPQGGTTWRISGGQ